MMMKNDLKYVGSLTKHRDFRMQDLPDLPVWELLKARYGDPLFGQGIGLQLGAVSRYYNQKVLVVSAEDAWDEESYSSITYVGCNFSSGTVHTNGSISKIVLGNKNVEHNKINLEGTLFVMSVRSLESLDSQQLLQFTFNTGHTKGKGVYLRDVVDTNPFTAANNLLDLLAKESNLHIPVRLNNVQFPEPGYLQKVKDFKAGMIFQRDNQPEYDNF